MKRFILITGALCILTVALFLAVRRTPTSPPMALPETLSQNGDASADAFPANEPASAKPTRRPMVNRTRHVSEEPAETPPVEPAVSEETMALRQSVGLLVAPHATFQEKQAIWQQLRKDGKLTQAVAELERGATNNPTAAEYPAALGQAYIHQITPGIDFRQQAMLGMKADESFEAALKIDPNNWEAGFYRAAALSHWPAELNKTPEVIEQFNSVMKQQETMPQQPQFAATYVMLGEQYQKSGHSEYAQQIWQRGASLFPTNQALQKKISGQP